MIKTEITTDKSFLSLNYNTENGFLSGDNQFYITLNDVGNELVDNLEVNLTADESLLLIPETFTAEIGVPQLVVVRMQNTEVLPEGNFNFKVGITSEYSSEKIVNTSILSSEKIVNTSILSSKKNTLNPDVYKFKYFIQREKYTARIFELVAFDAVLTPIEINGKVSLSYQERKYFTEPIIASTLEMDLEASIERDLSELNTRDEKTFKVEIEKEGNLVFSGFILPDQSWRSFVTEIWNLKVKAVCGLASLKNISFAQKNSTGDNLVNFFGRMTAIEIINNCLEKTGLNLPIYVNCQIVYDGWVGHNILSSVYLSVERFFQNKDEPMDCEAILSSVMQIFGATILQYQNSWYIYRSKDLTNENPLTTDSKKMLYSLFFGSTYQQNILLDFGGISVGSQINNAEIYHCNENQMIRENSAVSAYQISYQFGDAKNILANGGLILEGATGINIPGWIVNTSPDGLVDRGVRIGYNYGIRSAVRPLDPLPLLLSLNQSISVVTGMLAVLRIKYRNDGQNSLYLNFAFSVFNPGITAWYNYSTGNFQSTYVTNRIDNYYQQVSGGNATNYGKRDAIFEVDLLMPIDGNVAIHILRNGHGTGDVFGVHSVEFFPSSKGNIKSKDYIARKNNAVSSAVKDSITVFNGDSKSDLFVGTIFESDSDTPTLKWNRYIVNNDLSFTYLNDNKEILEIIAGEGLSVSPRPMSEFEGDFKGYIGYLNFFYIDSFLKPYADNFVKKQFQFLKWSYSFDDDVTKMFAREIEGLDLDPNTYNVKIYENFGNENKITLIS